MPWVGINQTILYLKGTLKQQQLMASQLSDKLDHFDITIASLYYIITLLH